MADIISIAPANVLLDENNPRLSQPNAGQREALRSLARSQNRKLLALAKDIVLNGMDPSNLLIVMPAQGDHGRYIALEGNRRVTALKALENPESVAGAVDAAVLAGLRQLSNDYQAEPVELITCVSCKSREEARHWIQLRHTGENEGAGVVRWGYDESSRFDARTSAKASHTQVLDFLEAEGDMSRDDRSKVPAASLRRMMDTPEIRAKLGIDMQAGKLQVLGDKDRVVKALNYIVDQLVTGETKTKHIYTKPDREKYAENIPKHIVVPVAKSDGKPTTRPKRSTRKTKIAALKRAKERTVLIPADCVMNITDQRVSDIAGELRTLNFHDYPNAAAVLLRVFIELSVDAYLGAHSLKWDENTKLRQKLTDVLDDLLKQTKLSRQQAAPVRKAAQKESFMVPSIHLMNQYVHNQHIFPAPRDLRAYWNDLQPFLVAIWSV